MKTPRLFLFILFFLLLQASTKAQVQWFQNQCGDNEPPNGTSGTCVKNFTSNSFVACYLWKIENEISIWKISRTNFNGTELKTLFLNGASSMVEMRVGRNNTIYVLQRNYPFGLDPEYKLYKLDEHLHIKAQKILSFPNGYSVFNLNCFELDDNNNVYLAGDGQYPDPVNEGSFLPASFVMKTNKSLSTQWRKMNYSQTSYTRLHIDDAGKVTVIGDYYTFFPDLHIRKFSSSGQLIQLKTITTDAGRYNLYSSFDADDNLLLYGGKTIGDTAQGMYLYKLSRTNYNVIYEKTHFVASGSQLNDLRVDNNGKIFALVTLYLGTDQISRISRINPGNGNISWNHSIPYSQDSCNLVKLAMDNNERFYAIGQRNSNNYFAKGFAVRMKKNGQCEGNISGPDSVCFQRIHWLNDGIIDQSERLISIGGTFAFDTLTYEMTDIRAFAVRFDNNNNCDKPGTEEMFTAAGNGTEEETDAATKLSIYPNPVQEKLTISNLQAAGYDRIAVYNMQGALLLKQSANGNATNVDMTTLSNGVYLLVLRSSATLKEKSLKFVVKR
ncbi:MAG: T9SS type A sorting domain-containing protein [Chitinophagaceae bacterium]|nr:T9SS type A sorting domain-containing protein [Chitinophagaceae bacterium]